MRALPGGVAIRADKEKEALAACVHLHVVCYRCPCDCYVVSCVAVRRGRWRSWTGYCTRWASSDVVCVCVCVLYCEPVL